MSDSPETKPNFDTNLEAQPADCMLEIASDDVIEGVRVAMGGVCSVRGCYLIRRVGFIDSTNIGVCVRGNSTVVQD